MFLARASWGSLWVSKWAIGDELGHSGRESSKGVRQNSGERQVELSELNSHSSQAEISRELPPKARNIFMWQSGDPQRGFVWGILGPMVGNRFGGTFVSEIPGL